MNYISIEVRMSVKNEFSKYAKSYNSYNIIQQIIAKSLIRELAFHPKTILELGCGSGQVYRNITWNINTYKAIDFSQDMCNIHPKGENISVECFDFDSKEFIDSIKNDHYDVIISSSALQWSNDLSTILQTLSKISKQFHGVLFTSNTFKTIQEITHKKSPILSEDKIKDSFEKYYKCEFETILYKLEFETKKELFDYIKKSGVSGESELTFKEAKFLYKNYNLNYLEFEVVFVKGNSRF